MLVRYLTPDGALGREHGGGYSVMENLALISAEISHAHWRSYLGAHGVKPLPSPINLRGEQAAPKKGISREGIRNALLGGGEL